MSNVTTLDDVRTKMGAVLREVAISGGEDAQCDIAALPGLPADVTSSLAGSDHWRVLAAVAENTDTGEQYLRFLAAHPLWEVRRAAARNTSTPPDVLAGLVFDEEEAVVAAVAANPSADSDTLISLAAASQPRRTVEEVAGNPNVPLALLERLRAHTEPLVRGAAFANPLSGASLTSVYGNESPMVKAAAARNPRCPASVLHELALGGHRTVQQAAVGHSAVRADTLRRIIDDAVFNGDDDMLIEVAKRPHCAPELLDFIAGSYAHDAICDALANPCCPPETVNRVACRHDDYLSAAAGNPNAPVDVLAAATNHPDREIRCGVAANTRLPGDLAEQLFRDSDPAVREVLARNPSTPRRVLSRLHLDKGHLVAVAAAGNENCEPKLLAIRASSPNRRVRLQVARNPNCPDYVLNRLASSRDSETVRCVAANPASAPATLFAALDDPAALPATWMAVLAAEPAPGPPGMGI